MCIFPLYLLKIHNIAQFEGSSVGLFVLGGQFVSATTTKRGFKMGKRARVVEVVSTTDHLDEKTIKEAIDKHSSIKEWAYILHDKDKITDEDTALDNIAEGQERGELKKAHWHVVMSCPNAVDIESLAKWFGVGLNFVEIKNGHGAFLDCVEYLTHERAEQQEKGKHLYSDGEVKSNIAWRDRLNEREEEREKFGGFMPQTEKDFYFASVSRGFMTPAEIERENPIFYAHNFEKLKRLRKEYISDRMPIPRYRSNFYITGKSGLGKTQFSKMFARSLVKNGYDMPGKDVYFEVGHKGSRFDGYNGQEVIIWNDCRAIDILMEFNRSGAFNLFEEVPSENAANIKYGSVVLKNRFWIINGIDSRDEFLKGLAGEYTDKSGELHKGEETEVKQSYRRFPHFFEIDETEIRYAISQGWYQDTDDFESYKEYITLTGNIGHLLHLCGHDEKTLHSAAAAWIAPAVEKHNEVVREKFGVSEVVRGQLLDEFGIDLPELPEGLFPVGEQEEKQDEKREEERDEKPKKKSKRKPISKRKKELAEELLKGVDNDG